MTFEEWLEEIVETSSRRDHISKSVDFASVMTGNMSHNLARTRMYEWLESAYQAGREDGYTRTWAQAMIKEGTK